MKKPKKVKILQDTFTIHWDKKLVDCKGYTETAVAEIHVDTSFDLPTQKHVLLHEILHGIYYSYHLNPPKKYKTTDIGEADDLEEYIVSVYAPAILQVLNDNPKIKSFLFD